MRSTISRMVVRSGLALGCICLCMAQDAPRRVLVHGHRGARASRPENTLPAFQFAIDAGTDVLELDISVTKDNVLVVSHDPFLRPPLCTGPQKFGIIRKLTLEEVKQWDCGATQNPEFGQQKTIPGTKVPTLDEVFQLASQGTFEFNIETKSTPKKISPEEAAATLKRIGIDPASERGRDAIFMISELGPDLTPPPDEFARMVLEKIQKYHLENRVIVQSFDFRTLIAMKKIAPKIRLSALTTDSHRTFVEIAHEAGAGIISPVFQTVTAAKVKEAHDAGVQVVPWTANKPADWDMLIAAGSDAIITDDPDGLIHHIKSRKAN